MLSFVREGGEVGEGGGLVRGFWGGEGVVVCVFPSACVPAFLFLITTAICVHAFVWDFVWVFIKNEKVEKPCVISSGVITFLFGMTRGKEETCELLIINNFIILVSF